jgi:hypothetical protein
MRIRRIFSSVACPALPYFPHYVKKGTIFWKEALNMKCVFRLSLQICLKHFSFQEELREIS